MKGSLVCVGTGMMLGAHISPICQSHIEHADVVFSLMASAITERWLAEKNNDVRSLQSFYQEGKNRNHSYNEMVNAIIDEVKAGKKVVAAFYGHPGVFACVAHRAIKIAHIEGFNAHMEPGISAESCLYADLSIDPGSYGCAHFEASQFLFYQRQIDTSAYLVLWQVGFTGDRSLTKFNTDKAYKQVLVDLLTTFYPDDHLVILYQAKVLPIETVRADKVPLNELASHKIYQHTTLVIPPTKKMLVNQVILDKLEGLGRKSNQPKLKLV
ncbi:SAM-dependent methyltransferase [Colwellia asteriadis]|uniref:SAM-dependent methyltransferase n=1 Tax=Colwellia asteriadis TaxID=517723 RepID=A0ABN1L9K4_9GAMM